MLNRRQLRIKAMEVIYAFDIIQKLCDHELSDEERKIFGMLKKTYSKKINDVILFFYCEINNQNSNLLNNF